MTGIVGITVNGTNGHKEGQEENLQEERKRNDSAGGWVVQKFGGTSVGKFSVNIAEDIVKYASLFLWNWKRCQGGTVKVRC